ncbi:MAG: metallophosphoesterase [Clostridium sp.]|nr:metallophosphoesterase [Clostridium sp.]
MPKVSKVYYSLHRILALAAIFIVVIGCDAFVWSTSIRYLPLAWQILWWTPTFLLCCCFSLIAEGNWGWPSNALMALVVCIVFPELLYTIVTLIGMGIGFFYPKAVHWSMVVGGVIAAIAFLCGLYGVVVGWKRITITNVKIASPRLPAAFDGYRIAQFSDLHLGTFAAEPSFVQKLMDRINSLDADLIVFTGDLVNFTSAEAEPFKKALSGLSAPDGVISILGNHDYALYAPVDSEETRMRCVNRLISLERSLGWRLLLDESTQIKRGDSSIWIAGVENIGRQERACKGNLSKALHGIPKGAFTVLLSHDPSHWVDEVVPDTDIPLTLSGHTHAMQLKVFGWSPSAIVSRHWGGAFNEGDRHLFVSTGAGANLPFRFGAWPEIALITLSKS